MVFTRTVNRDYGSDYSVYDVVRSVCLVVCIPRDLPVENVETTDFLLGPTFLVGENFELS